METIALNRESSGEIFIVLKVEGSAERAVMLQNSVISLESEIQNLSSELENYRQCVCSNSSCPM